ncbi:T9SS type A sorting domain-containing protein [candidate division TA06 bacterium]|uniref:T9SS type A sorting domain-containing protein n=1 Tax=candidate division TA06 bacterium TaxID=2250710 RepID=A0A523XLL0_UNCT6|nr:MAG: T9SS type A sorting domain-containing protein [candidate division TA06 bacterium]
MMAKVTNINSYIVISSVALLLCLLVPTVRAERPQLTVVPQNDKYVDLVYRTARFDQATLSIDGVTYRQLFTEGCSAPDKPGDPAILKKELVVGIPLDASPSVEVLGVKTRTLRKFLLAPVPRIVADSLGLESYIYDANPASYDRSGFIPRAFVEVSGTGFLRNQRVAHIGISAVRFDARRRVVELCEEVRIRVRFNRTGRNAGTSLPRDGFERLYQSVLANYSQSRTWRQAPKVTMGVLDLQQWVKISLNDRGIYKLTYDDLRIAGVPVELVDPRTFLLINGGSRPLPESLSTPRPESIEVAIYVEGEEDGRIDPSDYILFYAVSLTGWSLDVTADSFYHFLNPYAETNVYWLKWGGTPGPRMDTLDVYPQDPDPTRPLAFEDRIHLEEEVESPMRSGLRWIWHRLKRDAGADRASFTTQVYPVDVASETCDVRMGFFVDSDTVMNVKLYLNGEVIVDQPGPRMSGKKDPPIVVGGTAHSLVEGRNYIKVELTRGGTPDSLDEESRIFVDFFDLRYERHFRLAEGKLEFSTQTPAESDIVEYKLENVDGTPFILNVTDPFHPIRLINYVQAGSEVTLQAEIFTTQVYSAATSFLRPIRLEMDSPNNLKQGGADYVAICHEPFMPAVADLISWRNSYISGIPSPKATMVGMIDVLDNFSWGLMDPTAIRDFLAWTLSNWNPAPSYCLLAGASTYDYKNNLKLAYPKNFIPPHVNGYVVVSRIKFAEGENPCFDDWFIWLTAGDNDADMYLGRFDAVSSEEARILTLKAINCEQNELLGAWKNRVLLVADDQEPNNGDSQFTNQCENLSRIIPARIDLLKVYLVEYPKVGEDKPGARDAMIDCINNGVFSGIFLGHGNIKKLAHENAFRSPEDVSRLVNGRMAPFYFYGSCSVGLFDRPTASSMSGLISKTPYGGTIVSLGASRPTYGGPNAMYSYELFDNMYSDSSLTTAGEIVYAAKISTHAAAAEYYLIFGDPAVKIVPPALRCSLDVIPDSMVGLTKVMVKGMVEDSTFEGWGMLRAFDSAHMESDTSQKFGSVVNYELPGDPFYWGLVSVEQGKFTHTFRVPKIESGSIREGYDGRVSVYVWNDQRDGSGAVDSLYVGGNSGPITDLEGPNIRIQHEGREVTDSFFVNVGSKITGIISDESGIYLGDRPDRILRMVINGDELNSVHLNELFNYDQGSDTLGRFNYTLELPEGNTGRDSLTFIASDNYLNRSEMSVIAIPVGPNEMSLGEVLNYPNPFENDTYFTFTINQPGKVTVKVYTIGGRLIKTLSSEFASSGYHQIYWDGKDEDGDRPANGVYLYKVIAKTEGFAHEVATSSKAEVIEKLLIVR